MITRRFASKALFVSLLMPTLAFGAAYTEANDGDLSGNLNAPTTFTLTMGSNTLNATTVKNDEDYVRIVVPAMHSLLSVTPTFYNGASLSFIAFQTGNVFTESVAAPNTANLSGYQHFSGASGNMLNTMKNGINGFGTPLGYTQPLAAGNYTFWLHETSMTSVNYTLTFVVQANASVQAPVIAPSGGSFADAVQISMSTTTGNSTIYYTTNGTTPTTASTPYTGPFAITSSQTIKAFAHDNNNTLTDSLVTTEAYTVTPTPAPTVIVTGSKSIKTTKTSVKLKGTATNATSIKFKVGSGPFKTAAGTSAWSLSATKLKPGKNIITIEVTGINGTATTKVTVTVKKKK